MKKILLFLSFLFTIPISVIAQQTIKSININGNTKTKTDIIIREISFKKNKSYSKGDLDNLIKESIDNLVNLKIFNFVEIKKNDINNYLEINIDVVEKWYIWPYPTLEISERNFNSWWQAFKESDYSDFSRLNYGGFLKWENFRGRNELLKLKIAKGFKENYKLTYNVPYFNSRKTLGFNLNLEFHRKKKTFYKSENNKLIYYENEDEYTSKDFIFDLELLYRKGIRREHKLKFGHYNSTISDSIKFLNNNYLQNNKKSGSYVKLTYGFSDENRDYIVYPLNGHLLSLGVSKYFASSSPVSHLEFTARVEKHIEPKNRLFLGSSFSAKFSSEDNIAYFAQKKQGFGFKHYVRGYEYYVVDGQDFWLSRTALKYAIIEKTEFEMPYIKMTQFKKAHHSIYFGVFSDMGYICDLQNTNTNPLQKKLLWGKGISLDYVTYYDRIIRIEYSINHLGEKGVFLHFSNPFGSKI